MLGLRIADELRALLAIVLFLFPLCQSLAAVSIAHFANKIACCPFDRAIAKWIHGDTERHMAQRIALVRTRQHWRLVAEPPQIAQEHQDEQTRPPNGNAEMSAGKLHLKSLGQSSSVRKITRETGVTRGPDNLLSACPRPIMLLKAPVTGCRGQFNSDDSIYSDRGGHTAHAATEVVSDYKANIVMPWLQCQDVAKSDPVSFYDRRFLRCQAAFDVLRKVSCNHRIRSFIVSGFCGHCYYCKINAIVCTVDGDISTQNMKRECHLLFRATGRIFYRTPLHLEENAGRLKGSGNREIYVIDARDLGIHRRIGHKEAFTDADVQIFLFQHYFQLTPPRLGVLCIQVILEQVVRRSIISGSLKCPGKIVGVVEGLTAGHFCKIF